MFGYENINNLYIVELKNNDYVCARYCKDFISDVDEFKDINGNKKYKYEVKSFYSITDIVDPKEIKYCKYISKRYIWKIVNELNKRNIIYNKDKEASKEIKENKRIEKEIEKTKYKILTDSDFDVEPAICIKNELTNLIAILATEKKNPILVGESGVGKTAIVDELAYLIQQNEIPNFLKNRNIVEVSPFDLVAGTKWSGTLEKKFNKLIKYIKDTNSILFIDEIHNIYGAGSTSKDDNDIASQLKKVIDRENIRVIGTTTQDEYDKYFSNDALKRRFEIVRVKEPKAEDLRIIARKVFEDYSEKTMISISKIQIFIFKIIDILISATKEKEKDYFDKVSNPDLIISIIDKSFASAKINNRSYLSIDDIIYGIETSERIYDSSKETAKLKLDEYKKKPKKLVNKSNIVSFRC